MKTILYLKNWQIICINIFSAIMAKPFHHEITVYVIFSLTLCYCCGILAKVIDENEKPSEQD